MNTFILSPCGISTLLAVCKDEQRKILNINANASSAKDVIEADRLAIDDLINNAQEALQNANNVAVRRMSAELGALTLYYNDRLDFKNDVHFLLSSDTWLGEACTNLIRGWLEHKGATCIVHRQEGLQTQKLPDFHNALAELAPQLIEQIDEYKKKHFRVAFNLTAGFKAVQGFLQTLGMFHADELIYVFERTDHLMRIPRIPVRIDGIEDIRGHLDAIRKLSLGLSTQKEELSGVPETMLLNVDDEIILSAWGNIFWQEAQKILYEEKIYAPVCDKVRLTHTFISDVKKLPPDRLVILNQRLDQLCRSMHKSDSLAALSFKKLKGKPVPGSTHEFNAWSDKDAKRCFGHFEDDCFIIDQLEKHLK